MPYAQSLTSMFTVDDPCTAFALLKSMTSISVLQPEPVDDVLGATSSTAPESLDLCGAPYRSMLRSRNQEERMVASAIATQQLTLAVFQTQVNMMFYY